MQTKFIIFIVLVVFLVGGFGIYTGTKSQNGGKLDGFAQCIKSSGAEFYGAFWCVHCQEQKTEFGSSKQYLPYIECANSDNTQIQICIDKKIEGYPTWVFKDGSRLSGKLSLETLAEKTQCILPQ
ncbi:MAG: thioredoxin domain-containing protein [Candidatus Paceibacterota bacterium]